jgi:hypothetical protein
LHAGRPGTIVVWRRASGRRKRFAWEIKQFSDSLSPIGELRADLANLIEVFDRYVARRGRLILDFAFEGPGSDELRSMAPMLIEALDRSTAIISSYQSSGELLGGDPREATRALVGPLILRQGNEARKSGDAAALVERFLLGWKASRQG